MNQLFKELYEKATGQSWAYDFDFEIAEVFALLIMRETFDWINMNCGYMPDETWQDLKRHFDVKEY